MRTLDVIFPCLENGMPCSGAVLNAGFQPCGHGFAVERLLETISLRLPHLQQSITRRS